MRNKKLLYLFSVLIGIFMLAVSLPAEAQTFKCATGTQNGFFCDSSVGKSWCNLSASNLSDRCIVENTTSSSTTPNGTYYFSCYINNWVLSCNSGYNQCTNPSSPNYNTCVYRTAATCLPGQTYDPCSNSCTGTVATLNLNYDSAPGVSPGTGLVNSSNPVLSIPSSGNIGIGTTTPVAKFDLLSNISADADTYGIRSVLNFTEIDQSCNYLGYGGYFKATDSNTASTGGIYGVYGSALDSNGNSIGIYGVSADGGGVGVQGSSSNGNGVSGMSTIGYGGVFNSNHGYALTASSNDGPAALFANNGSSTQFAIYSLGGKNYFAGNVGIGTIAPISQTVIYGTGQLTSALADSGSRGGILMLNTNSTSWGNGGAIAFGNVQSQNANSLGFAAIKGLLENGNGNTTGDIAFSTRNATTDTALTERMKILSNGNVGIGTTTPSEKLEVNGNVKAVSFIYTSDRNLKKNIETIQNPLAKIMQLRGVTFNWKNNNQPSVGLIAQEVQKVFPQLVVGQEGGLGVQYGNLVAPLIEAVKAQQVEIQGLQAQINSLKAAQSKFR